MIRMKRKAVLAAVLGAAAVAAAVPMVVSGTASAQAGSRLCARTWFSPSTGETVTKIYEVQKEDTFTCLKAVAGQNPGDSPFAGILKNREFNTYSSGTFTMVCEELARTSPGEGGFFGKTLVNPDRSPVADQVDVCNNMERSDNLGDMERYWIFYNGDPNNNLVELNRN